MAGGELLGSGVYIGRDLFGSAFCFDPFLAYAAGIVRSPNMVVLGQLGHGKSSLVKSFAWRQMVFGRQVWALDPKGEYAPLAAAVGVAPFTLRPGGTLRLNPLDPGPLAKDQTAEEVTARQTKLLAALGEIALGRRLSPAEHAACQEALDAVRASDSVPTLPRVVDVLLRPSEAVATNLATQVDRHAAEARDLALALRRLVHGDLAGMFDGPTTPGLNLGGDLVVLDLSAVYESEALGVFMTCASAFLTARLRARDGRKRIVITDEAWAVLSDLGMARWMRASWKLARQYGVCHIAVLHGLSDLDAAGTAGSEQERLALGLIRDTETRVIYNQSDHEAATTRARLNLSDTEAAIIPTMPPGRALWKVKTHSALVDHLLGPTERALIDTDAAMNDTPAIA